MITKKSLDEKINYYRDRYYDLALEIKHLKDYLGIEYVEIKDDYEIRNKHEFRKRLKK